VSQTFLQAIQSVVAAVQAFEAGEAREESILAVDGPPQPGGRTRLPVAGGIALDWRRTMKISLEIRLPSQSSIDPPYVAKSMSQRDKLFRPVSKTDSLKLKALGSEYWQLYREIGVNDRA
jgi:hypothetical protein